MLSNIESAAAALREARFSRKQIAPASTFKLGSIDQAYETAAENTRVRIAEGRDVTGRKIGLTAEAVQRQIGVDQPDFDVLFDDMEILDRGLIPTDRLMQPKIEAEIAFVIGRDLKAGRGPSSRARPVPALRRNETAKPQSRWRTWVESMRPSPRELAHAPPSD